MYTLEGKLHILESLSACSRRDCSMRITCDTNVIITSAKLIAILKKLTIKAQAVDGDV